VKKLNGGIRRPLFVARGRVKFRPPKPGGRRIAEKHFPDFRKATPATWEYLNKKPKDSRIGFRRLNTRRAKEKETPVLAA
jgi:hypothetical protein